MKYFYHLHHFQGELPRDKNRIPYHKMVKNYLDKPSKFTAHGLDLANQLVNDSILEREDFIISFNNDVRRYVSCGVKEVEKEDYLSICKMEDEIINHLSAKQKELLSKFNITPWHRPFKEDENGVRKYYVPQNQPY